MKYIFIGLLVIALIILAPLATIWAWNVLFGSYIFIATTWQTWLAVIILGGAVTYRG